MNRLFKFNQLTKFMNKHEVYYSINISLKNRYIYFETAKAACTTIKRTLMNLELNGTNYHPKRVHLDVFSTPFVKLFQLDFDEVLKLLDSKEFIKFGFVRNPYLRVLSCYLDKIENNKPQKIKILKTIGMTEKDIERKIEFEEFIDILGQQKPKEMDQHWRPQYYQLFGGLIGLDFIGRVETLKKDMEKIEELSGCNIMVHYEDVLWHKTDSNNKYKNFYSKKIAKKVQNIYECDFEHFNYSTNWRKL